MDGDSPMIVSTCGLLNAQVTHPSDSRYCRWLSLCSVSNASVDLPDPDRPVNTTSWFLGMLNVIFFKLCSRAPLIVITSWSTMPSVLVSRLKSKDSHYN